MLGFPLPPLQLRKIYYILCFYCSKAEISDNLQWQSWQVVTGLLIYRRSNSRRSQLAHVAAASYVLCRKSNNTSSREFEVLTTS
jgi:hypothetical protein